MGDNRLATTWMATRRPRPALGSESDWTVAPITRVDGQAFGSGLFAVRLAASLGEFVAEQLDAVDRGRLVCDEETGIWPDDMHA